MFIVDISGASENSTTNVPAQSQMSKMEKMAHNFGPVLHRLHDRVSTFWGHLGRQSLFVRLLNQSKQKPGKVQVFHPFVSSIFSQTRLTAAHWQELEKERVSRHSYIIGIKECLNPISRESISLILPKTITKKVPSLSIPHGNSSVTFIFEKHANFIFLEFLKYC